MLLHLQEGPFLKSKGKAGCGTRIAVLTWRSLLIMSREWKYYWLRLILCMLLTLCVGTVFSGLGHSLSSVVVSFLNSCLIYYLGTIFMKYNICACCKYLQILMIALVEHLLVLGMLFLIV